MLNKIYVVGLSFFIVSLACLQIMHLDQLQVGTSVYAPANGHANLEAWCESIGKTTGNSERLVLTFLQTSEVPFANLFQTADLNDGLRIEISPTLEVNVIVGFEDRGTRDPLEGMTLSGLRTAENKIEIRLEGATMFAKLNNGPSESYLVQDPPACTNVIVGQGYGVERKFGGFIHAFLFS